MQGFTFALQLVPTVLVSEAESCMQRDSDKCLAARRGVKSQR
jgi:hypothetical protein